MMPEIVLHHAFYVKIGRKNTPGGRCLGIAWALQYCQVQGSAINQKSTGRISSLVSTQYTVYASHIQPLSP